MSFFGHLFRILFGKKSRPGVRVRDLANDMNGGSNSQSPTPPPPEAVRAEARPIDPEPAIIEPSAPTLPSEPAAAPVSSTPPPSAPPPPPPPPPPASGLAVSEIIRLGSVDADVPESAWSTFIGALQSIGRVQMDDILAGLDKIVLSRLGPAAAGVMTVMQLQTALRHLGFYNGGEVDGICGYRTSAAIRLFQEYVRTMEGQADFLPDGIFGPASNAQLQRWLSEDLRPDWQARPGEYEKWLEFLGRVRADYAANPSPVMQAVNAFQAGSDTRKINEWDVTGPGNIHLIGVRRTEHNGHFDDIFVLLLDGMVFKFQGSTEAGQSSHPKGPPYIVPGQHDYHFGWHQKKYQALRPLSQGVLIIRGGANNQLDADDLDRGLEPNATINIHWAGKGLQREINNWSEGCQVITGSVYINPRGDLIDCSDFTASNNTTFNESTRLTRGAYTLLSDLIASHSGDMDTNKVLYTMIEEADLELDTDIKTALAAARNAVFDRAT